MEGNDSTTTPVPRCAEHDGAHSRYLGRCYAFGRDVPRPLIVSRLAAPCSGCGRRTYSVTVRSTMARYSVDAVTGEQHECPPQQRVSIDADELATGIASALFGLMERRRERRPTSRADHQATGAQQPVVRTGEGMPLGGVPTVT